MDWERTLARAGRRLTASRRAVMQVLLEAAVPLSPQAIYERARPLHPPLGLVTVYRTLDVLVELGLLRRVHRDGGCHGYVLASPGHSHTILCRGCGQAVEFPGGEDLDGLVAQVQQATGFRVEGHLLQLVGLCPACRSPR